MSYVDPYVATMNAMNSGRVETHYVDNTDYEGMRRANEMAEKAKAELEAAKKKSEADAVRAWWKPRTDAAEGQVIHSDLNYRAWRAVAEAVESGLGAGMFGRPLEPSPSLVLRHFQTLIAERKAAPGEDREITKQFALVERWRLMGFAMSNRMEILPDDRAENGLDYYKLSGQLHNGVGERKVQDVVFFMEEERRPGMVVNITQAGLRALAALDKKGLAPAGIWAAIQHVADQQEKVYRDGAEFRAAEAQGLQRQLDALYQNAPVLSARKDALEKAQKEQNKRGPGWFGKSAWVEALGKTTENLAQVQAEIAAHNQEVNRLLAAKKAAESRRQWSLDRQKYDIAHTVALVNLDDEIVKDPKFMERFAALDKKAAAVAADAAQLEMTDAGLPVSG